MKIINPFDYKELIKQTKKEHGFDIKKDLSDSGLSEEEFFIMLQDLHLSINAKPKSARQFLPITPTQCIKRGIGTKLGILELLEHIDY